MRKEFLTFLLMMIFWGAGMLFFGETARADVLDDVGSRDLKLVIDGKTVKTEPSEGQAYISKSGRTMLPLRVVGETLNASVVFLNGTIYIENPLCDYTAWFQMGDKRFVVNGVEKQMDRKPSGSPEDRTYLPARAVGETFGKVDWDSGSRTVTITSRLKTERNAQKYTVDDTCGYMLSHGYDLGTGPDIYIQRLDLKNKKSTYLAIPEPALNLYKTVGLENLVLNKVKPFAGGYAMAVDTPRENIHDQSMDVFLDNGSEKDVIYAGTVKKSADFVSDGTHLFSTDGVLHTDAPLKPTTLFINKIGEEEVKTITLDDPVNESRLLIEKDALIIKKPNGTEHRLSIKDLLAKVEA